MSNFSIRGPICTVLDALQIDAGTLCRSASAVPGVLHHHQGKKHHHHAQRDHSIHRIKAKATAVPSSPGAGLTDADYNSAALALGDGISPALVRAFAEVESGGKSGFGLAGLPIIAFEGHWFRRYTHAKFDLTHPMLSYPYLEKAGTQWRVNNGNQATAWEALKTAMALDHDAALRSCSWGMFQVMGFNFEACGYSTVDDFVTAMKGGEIGQLQAFLGYCKQSPTCIKAMQAKDFAAMARSYNGKDYGDYDKRIARAYKKHGGT